MSNIPTDPSLAKFPRPANDNGRGLHFSLDQRAGIYIPNAVWMNRMQICWSTIYCDDENTGGRAARHLFESYGIVSQIRIQATGEMPHAPSSWAGYTRHIRNLGLPPYMKIFNEPGDGREGWDSYEEFAAKWNERAQAVVAEGGYPGLQVLDEDALAITVAGMTREVADNFYFSLHNYGANHPPQYPYPDKTALEDDTCVLRFLAFAEYFQKHLGKVPPMLGSEGGWLYGNHDDAAYPKVEGETWRDWTLEMFDWFRTGVLSNGDSLPDYLFCVSPWLLNDAKWSSDSWINGNNEAEIAPLRAELETSTPFIRQFGASMPPPKPNQTLEEAVLTRVNATNLMPVNEQAALYKFAVANALGFQQSDELELSFNGQTYVAQAFNRGILYAKKWDWGNIRIIPK